MTNLYIARHGETDLNKAGVYYGWSDISLTSDGRTQCENLRDKLKNIKFDAVISSPLIRAVESAEIITGFGSRDIIKYDQLKEMNFGKWENMHYKDIGVNYAEDFKQWAENWQEFCIPGGESFNNVFCRVKECLDYILLKYTGKSVIIIAHEGTLRIISLILLNMKKEDYWKFKFEFGAYSTFEIKNDTAVIRKINC